MHNHMYRQCFDAVIWVTGKASVGLSYNNPIKVHWLRKIESSTNRMKWYIIKIFVQIADD